MVRMVKEASRIRNLLVYCGVMACLIVAYLHATAQEAPAGKTFRVLGVAKGRVNISSPVPPLKLEEGNEIPILVNRDQEIHSANLSLDYTDTAHSHYFGSSVMNVTIMHHSDGSAYVTVIPENLGKVRIHLQIDFEDGYMDVAHVDDAEVVLPDRSPEKLYVDDPDIGTIYLDLTGRAKSVMLRPKAFYPGALHAVAILPEYLTFSVIAENRNDPPVTVDMTGTVVARRYGHALVETDFGGISTLTCFDVQNDANSGNDRTTCAELVPPGMTPPKSGFEDLPAQMKKMRTTPRVQIPPPDIRIAPQ